MTNPTHKIKVVQYNDAGGIVKETEALAYDGNTAQKKKEKVIKEVKDDPDVIEVIKEKTH